MRFTHLNQVKSWFFLESRKNLLALEDARSCDLQLLKTSFLDEIIVRRIKMGFSVPNDRKKIDLLALFGSNLFFYLDSIREDLYKNCSSNCELHEYVVVFLFWPRKSKVLTRTRKRCFFKKWIGLFCKKMFIKGFFSAIFWRRSLEKTTI